MVLRCMGLWLHLLLFLKLFYYLNFILVYFSHAPDRFRLNATECSTVSLLHSAKQLVCVECVHITIYNHYSTGAVSVSQIYLAATIYVRNTLWLMLVMRTKVDFAIDSFVREKYGEIIGNAAFESDD